MVPNVPLSMSNVHSGSKPLFLITEAVYPHPAPELQLGTGFNQWSSSYGLRDREREK